MVFTNLYSHLYLHEDEIAWKHNTAYTLLYCYKQNDLDRINFIDSKILNIFQWSVVRIVQCSASVFHSLQLYASIVEYCIIENWIQHWDHQFHSLFFSSVIPLQNCQTKALQNQDQDLLWWNLVLRMYHLQLECWRYLLQLEIRIVQVIHLVSVSDLGQMSTQK